MAGISVKLAGLSSFKLLDALSMGLTSLGLFSWMANPLTISTIFVGFTLIAGKIIVT